MAINKRRIWRNMVMILSESKCLHRCARGIRARQRLGARTLTHRKKSTSERRSAGAAACYGATSQTKRALHYGDNAGRRQQAQKGGQRSPATARFSALPLYLQLQIGE